MDLPLLSTAEAAARLRVRPATLYAYVSRGMITRVRAAGGSFFDPLEIERFALGRRAAGRPEPGPRPGSPLMVLDTAVTLIEDDRLYFRGRDAVDLALDGDFADAAGHVWGVGRASFTAPPDVLAAAERACAALTIGAAASDRMQAAVVAASAADPLRDEPSAENAVRIGHTLLGVFAAGEDAATSVLRGLGCVDPSDALVRAVDAALTLSIDHDLAVSTLAARVAASARASAYACVSAALGAFHSPLHGDASRSAAALLRRMVDGDTADVALRRVLRANAQHDSGIPGFGHRAYRGADPRAVTILDLIAAEPAAAPVTDAVLSLAADIRSRTGQRPNIDLALGAIVVAAGLDDDAGAAIFATGRLVGWTAHVVEEYAERPMRLRPHGRHIER